MQIVPELIQQAAKQRLIESLPEQQQTLEKIREGRPLDAEKDENRKLAYIQRQVKCSRSVARRIAENEKPATLPLGEEQKNKAESLQGDTVDFLPICFLDIGRAASRSVALVTLSDRSPKGSGFMVSPRLFLTNQHVIPSKETARNRLLEFTYELDPDKQTKIVTRFQLDPDTFYLNNPQDDLDYALVALGPKVNGPLAYAELGFLPMIDAPDKWITTGFVNIIQHPNGEFKQLAVRENRITAYSDNTLIYGTDTLPGSSGSPVFNDEWEVLALHHWGEPHRAIADLQQVGEPIPNVGNEGIRLSAIINKLLDKLTHLTTAQEQSLLSEALNPTFRHPSLLGVKPLTSESIPPPIPFAMPSGHTSDSTFSVTVPLTITLGFGRQSEPTGISVSPPLMTSPVTSSSENAEAIIFKPDADYSNRKGYNSSFLGIILPLPELTVEQSQQVAFNQQPFGGNPHEFPYQHFSVVMNKVRKLPFFTAVNIDGASVVGINRDTGEVKRVENPGAESMEGYEKWYDDPRILSNETTHQELYDKLGLDFQRGHLVKRTDPSWGNGERAYKAQSDTFHFNNCSPQHRLFNPVNTRWAGVEDWITRESDNENIRITVFSGPVFTKEDPVIAGLPIPKQYWKVVVWAEQGTIRSAGILADQGDLLPKPGFKSEGLNHDDPKIKFPKSYHVAITTLEQYTQLNFGNAVRQGDIFPKGAEAMGQKNELNTFDDLRPYIFSNRKS